MGIRCGLMRQAVWFRNMKQYENVDLITLKADCRHQDECRSSSEDGCLVNYPFITKFHTLGTWDPEAGTRRSQVLAVSGIMQVCVKPDYIQLWFYRHNTDLPKVPTCISCSSLLSGKTGLKADEKAYNARNFSCTDSYNDTDHIFIHNQLCQCKCNCKKWNTEYDSCILHKQISHIKGIPYRSPKTQVLRFLYKYQMVYGQSFESVPYQTLFSILPIQTKRQAKPAIQERSKAATTPMSSAAVPQRLQVCVLSGKTVFSRNQSRYGFHLRLPVKTKRIP